MIARLIHYWIFIVAIAISCSESNEEPKTPTPNPPQNPGSPTIHSIDPLVGSFGTLVKIKGENFSNQPGSNEVKFNDKTATVLEAIATQLTVSVPLDAGTGNVTVTTEGGKADGPTFTYLFAPKITSVSPLKGRLNSEVIIVGENFDINVKAIHVKFNGLDALVKSVTPTEIVAYVPVSCGSGVMTVETLGGNAEGPVFTYIYTATVSTLAGDGFAGYHDAQGLAAKFNFPAGIAVDASDNIIVCDRDNSRIRRITPTGIVSTIMGSGLNLDNNGTGLLADLARPGGITLDNHGNFYFTTISSGVIKKSTPDFSITTYSGKPFTPFTDGPKDQAGFNFPTSLAFNTSGELIVADLANYRIRKVSLDGSVTTLAGNGEMETVDGVGANASFEGPWGIYVDASDNIFVTDFGARIRKITPAGEVTTFAGASGRGFKDGPVADAMFQNLYGIMQWVDGSIIVCDSNQAIRMITTYGEVITLAGNGEIGFVDGIGSAARFNWPYGIAMNSKGEIFIAERFNRAVRKMVLK